MMEILVTLFIIMIGLLGIIALQGKAQVAELEAYQRTQALIALSDMNANRATVSCFAITTDTTNGTPYLGPGANAFGTPACAASTTSYNNRADAAITDIHNFFQGTSEQLSGNDVAAMLNGRACISYDNTTELGGEAGTGLYKIIVTWQAMGDLEPPPTDMCAKNEYGTELKRRAVSTSFRLANLY